MSVKQVLIITYYWPPSGGAGVQRWLKFVKYLPELGIKPFVLTVNPKYASYPVTDETLAEEIPPETEIFKTRSREPLNLYKKVAGEKEIPYAGFANQGKPNLINKISRAIRGNLFIPDARVGWNSFAYKKALEIIDKYEIDTLITTSPPHSTQLIGLKLKKKLGIKWISDLRDPWTDIYYYNQLYHTRFAKQLDKKYEKEVLRYSDKIVVVSNSIKEMMENKICDIEAGKINVIPNGFDETDFTVDRISPRDQFIVTHIGTLTNNQDPNNFFLAFKHLIENNPSVTFKLKFVGKISALHQTTIKNLGFEKLTDFQSHVNHKESVRITMSSSILLLAIAKTKENRGILSGKLFEYIAAGRPILGIGPPDGDAAAIIKECNAGNMFDYDDLAGMTNYLQSLINQWKENPDFGFTEKENSKKYTRRNLTKQLFNELL
jgi:glycosyltransferase involved in cell wall biosynthesis